MVIALVFCAGGCGDDKGDYEGVSNLLVERNRARLASNEEKKQVSDKQTRQSTSLKGFESSNGELVEEEINVVSVTSGKRLAKGTAYIDKKGKIITIKIRKK